MSSPLDSIRRFGTTLFLVEGVLSLILGVLILIWPVTAVLMFALLFGAWLIISGVASLASYFTTAKDLRSSWTLARGILMIVAGLVVVFSPGAGAVVLAWIAAFALLFVGVFQISGSFLLKSGQVSNWWILLVTGILSVVAGFCLMLYPLTGAVAMAYIVGVAVIAEGIACLAFALLTRRAAAAAERSIHLQ